MHRRTRAWSPSAHRIDAVEKFQKLDKLAAIMGNVDGVPVVFSIVRRAGCISWSAHERDAGFAAAKRSRFSSEPGFSGLTAPFTASYLAAIRRRPRRLSLHSRETRMREALRIAAPRAVTA
jgi:hypothetical protein